MLDFDAVIEFPAMRIGARTRGAALAEICYLPRSVPLVAPRNRLAERAARQFEQYLADPDQRFDLPLAAVGTAFQRRVWDAIAAIPRGRTLTYGQVARHLGSAPRAVGQACGANWFPLVVPCHRVVGSGGLGGFGHHGAGFHLEIKSWLLRHEGARL
ncbi:MAG: methylated-DNA--[protein]-cysteine S-methyltransferase [Burkholderiales bacterium]